MIFSYWFTKYFFFDFPDTGFIFKNHTFVEFVEEWDDAAAFTSAPITPLLFMMQLPAHRKLFFKCRLVHSLYALWYPPSPLELRTGILLYCLCDGALIAPHFFHLKPLPQGQGSLRPTDAVL